MPPSLPLLSLSLTQRRLNSTPCQSRLQNNLSLFHQAHHQPQPSQVMASSSSSGNGKQGMPKTTTSSASAISSATTMLQNVESLEAWAARISSKQKARCPAKVEEAQRRAQRQSRAKSYHTQSVTMVTMPRPCNSRAFLCTAPPALLRVRTRSSTPR